MTIYCERSLRGFKPWAGAIDFFNELVEKNRIDELEDILEELYPEGIDETELNDILWFEEDTIKGWLEMEEDD